jgi:hypothetical protein
VNTQLKQGATEKNTLRAYALMNKFLKKSLAENGLMVIFQLLE